MAKAQKNRRYLKTEPSVRATEPDSDETFAFIAGYTSGGAPYGITWEEMEVIELGTTWEAYEEARRCLYEIDCDRISDWESFHDVFAATFRFPSCYGRNLDAWIDCMDSLDGDESEGLWRTDDIVTVALLHAADLKRRAPALYDAIIDCSAFVNWR